MSADNAFKRVGYMMPVSFKYEGNDAVMMTPEAWSDVEIVLKAYKDMAVEKCGCDPKAFAPPHFASQSCESGGHNHCSCDRCF